MAEDGFEMELEGLFSQAPAGEGEEQFVQAVCTRTARLRRIGRLVHGLAFGFGGLIAVLELSQASLWQGLADWLTHAVAPLTDARLWNTPNPTLSLVVVGAMGLSVYLARVFRER